jgi:hypothetical protein
MTDNNDYLRTGEDRNLRLSGEVLMLMLKGAGYACIACLIVVFGIWAMYGVGKLLPEESRDTEDPTPFSYNLVIEDTDYA